MHRTNEMRSSLFLITIFTQFSLFFHGPFLTATKNQYVAYKNALCWVSPQFAKVTEFHKNIYEVCKWRDRPTTGQYLWKVMFKNVLFASRNDQKKDILQHMICQRKFLSILDLYYVVKEDNNFAWINSFYVTILCVVCRF